MDILGNIGQLYTILLLVLLIIGSGLAVWSVFHSILKNKNAVKDKWTSKLETIKNNKMIGGSNMKNNGFVKLAVFSFVGIIISMAVLSFLPNSSMNTMSNMGNTSTSNMYNQSTMMNQSSMLNQNSNMNMQGMSGNSSMSGSMSGQSVDLNAIQQQLLNMQQQINQIQQNQMNSMNSNSMNQNSNSNSSSGSMSSMPMM